MRLAPYAPMSAGCALGDTGGSSAVMTTCPIVGISSSPCRHAAHGPRPNAGYPHTGQTLEVMFQPLRTVTQHTATRAIPWAVTAQTRAMIPYRMAPNPSISKRHSHPIALVRHSVPSHPSPGHRPHRKDAGGDGVGISGCCRERYRSFRDWFRRSGRRKGVPREECRKSGDCRSGRPFPGPRHPHSCRRPRR
jgi:hypothetical protein